MNTTHTYLDTSIKGVILGILFLGTVSLGQFLAPPSSPFSADSNSPAPITTSNVAQIKQGDLGANYIVATNNLCLGSSCISSFWPSGALPTSCRLESKKIFNNTTNLAVYDNSCENMLSLQARAEGWVSTSFDYCTSLSGGNCNGQAQCHYMRLVCSGSATTTPGTFARYTIYPVTNGQTGDPYPTFMRDPQCNDGVDNDAATGTDYPADPQCTGFDDDSESS